MKNGTGKPTGTPRGTPGSGTITELLKPHRKALAFGLLAVLGEGAANLLEPWPLKIIFDNVLKSRKIHGWLNPLILSIAGDDKFAIVRFAAIAVPI